METPPMNDKPIIFVSLALALVVLTFPFWYALAAGRSDPPDLPDVPPGRCVEERSYMRAHHAELLNEWRRKVVREGGNVYTSSSGEKIVMSLTGTCLGCHTNRETFCDTCHDYANVRPDCWDCHVTPRGN